MQGRILARCAREGQTDAALAVAAGVDRSLISRWRSGEREIGLDDLTRLVGAYGAEIVLEPLARPDGCEVRRLDSEGAPALLRRTSIAVVRGAGELAAAVEEALEDGRLTSEEVEQLAGLTETLTTSLERLRAAMRPGRAA